MNKKVVSFITLIALLTITVIPVFAWDGIQFLVTDNKTSQPWGNTHGQSYRIIIRVAGTTQYDQTFTTPADPVLSFACAWGDNPCNGRAVAFPSTPTIGDTVDVYITLTGTNGNPSTVQDSFEYFADLNTNYVINRQSGTGPTAVTLADFNPASSSSTLPVIAVAFFALSSISFVMLRRRRQTA